MGAALSALATTRTFSLVLVYVAVLAAGTALITPNLSALVSSRAAHAGAALGLSNSATSLGQFAGPLAGSILLGWRAASPFLLGGAVLLATGIVVGFARLRPSPGLVAPARPGVAVEGDES